MKQTVYGKENYVEKIVLELDPAEGLTLASALATFEVAYPMIMDKELDDAEVKRATAMIEALMPENSEFIVDEKEAE